MNIVVSLDYTNKCLAVYNGADMTFPTEYETPVCNCFLSCYRMSKSLFPSAVSIIPPYSAPGVCWARPVVPSNTPCTSPRGEPEEPEIMTARASSLSAGNCRWPALGLDAAGGRKFWSVPPSATSSVWRMFTRDVATTY